MKIKRLASFGSALLLSLSSLLIIAVPKAAAATVTWDGEGADDNFSTAANWSGDTLPVDGDSLVFDPIVTGSGALNNDLTNLSLAGITISTGTTGQVRISGNELTFTGNITAGHHLMLETDVVIGAPVTIDVADEKSALFTGVISGSAVITKTGLGSINFQGVNTFTSDVIVDDGDFIATEPGAFGATAGSTTVNSGGSLMYAFSTVGNSTTIDEPLVFNSGTSTGGNPVFYAYRNYGSGGPGTTSETTTLAGSVTIAQNTIFSTQGKIKVTGTITGAFTITLPAGSSGSLELPSGIVPVTPLTTTVAESDKNAAQSEMVTANNILVVNGERGQIDVASGGTLKGTGKVGVVDVASGGKLAPGQSPGCLSSGNLTFVAGSTYEFEVGGATECTEYDQTRVTGTVTLGNGTLNAVQYNGFVPAAGQSYKIIDNDGGDVVSGTFNNLAEGATFTLGGAVVRISYVGGDGNDVVLTVVSAPSAPNTGFGMITNNPLATLAITTVLAAGIYLISRQQKLSLPKFKK